MVHPDPVWWSSLRRAALTGTLKFNTSMSCVFSKFENESRAAKKKLRMSPLGHVHQQSDG